MLGCRGVFVYCIPVKDLIHGSTSWLLSRVQTVKQGWELAGNSACQGSPVNLECNNGCIGGGLPHWRASAHSRIAPSTSLPQREKKAKSLANLAVDASEYLNYNGAAR
jgi:hypothetical protein